jgi:hypothetical protein
LGEEERDGKRRTMNFVFGCAYQFVGDTSDDLLVKVVPEAWPERPPQEPVSTGPAIQEVTRGARKAPGRTYQGEWRGKKGGDAMFEFVLEEGGGGRGEGGGGGGREWVRARRAGDRPGLPCRVLSYEDGALLYYKVVIL